MIWGTRRRLGELRGTSAAHGGEHMRKDFRSVWFVVAIAAGVPACMASGSAHYSASATATMPTMVSISPGVQVIEDYDEPVFYSSDAYWRYDGGVWYQSHTYTGGWARVSAAPPAIVSIQQPSMYVHYHASASAHGRATSDEQHERHDEQHERHDDDHDKGHKHDKR
jgi:hypothetical protein